MRNIKIALIALATGFFCHSSFADNNTDYSGVYFDAQWGWSTPHTNIQSVFNSSLATGVFNVFNFSPKLSVGYQFNQYYALQMGYMYAGGYTASADPSFKSSLSYYDIAAKATYPISTRFGIYGLLGLVYAQQSVSGSIAGDTPNSTANTVLPEIGTGLTVYFTPKFTMSLSALAIPGKDGIQANFYVPLGISYRF
jgi:hypothetical protein